MNSPTKKVFISHSHSDKDFAERLATSFLANGQDVWLDKWEIQPGDSIVKKIFEEGLGDASAFVVVLSKESVKSRWVREELDVAVVRRIEDLTRVIPVLKEDVEIPTSLRALHWIDIRDDYDSAVRAILNALEGISDKPAIGDMPGHLKAIIEPVAGLSRIASTVGYYLLKSADPDKPFLRGIPNTELAEALEFSPTEVNDAVDELESQGLVKTNNELGTAPYDFGFVEATYLLFHAFEQHLDYSPAEDVRVTLAAIAALEKAGGERLQRGTRLSAGRLNRAVSYIKDHGYAEVLQALGTAPFGFMIVCATRVTRQAMSR